MVLHKWFCIDLHTDESGYSAEYFCSMYRTVGKLIGSLGFTDEVCSSAFEA